MSTAIRKLLGPAMNRTRNHLTEGRRLLQNPEEQTVQALGAKSEHLQRCVTTMREQLLIWGQVIAVLATAPAKEAEEAIFDQFRSQDGEAPCDLIEEAREMSTDLDLRIDVLRALQRGVQNPNQGVGRQVGGNQPPPMGHQGGIFVPLPTTGLLDFDGTASRWPSFWQNFRDQVENRPGLSDAQKLGYLIGQLRGPVKDMVEGYALVDQNYPIVVDALRSRFGDDVKRAHELRSELLKLPSASNGPASLRTLSESVERLCRQLAGLNENMDNSGFLVTTLREKLPRDARMYLLEKEVDSGHVWTSAEWRQGLAKLVRIKESAQSENGVPEQAPASSGKPRAPPVWPQRAPPQGVRGFDRPQTRNGYNGPRSSTGPPNGFTQRRAFPIVEANRPKNWGERDPPPKCSLCLEKGHIPSTCPKYNTAKKRQQRLSEQNRCLICLREGHTPSQCPSPRACPRCQDKHHLIICPKPVQSKGRANQDKNLGSTQGLTTRASAISAPTHTEEPNKSPPAFLMVAEVRVYNQRDPTGPVKVPVFFDTGSQTSFITAGLVQAINPRKVSSEQLEVSGFIGTGNPAPRRFNSPRFSVFLEREDGGWEETILNRTDRITPPLECLTGAITNSPLQDVPSAQCLEPKVLIGVREFWKFVVSMNEVQPGLYRIDTIFGPVYGGEDRQPGRSSLRSLKICGAITTQTSGIHKTQEEEVANFWSLESLGINDRPDQDDDQLALEMFKRDINIDPQGRFEVSWPWKLPGEFPPDNFNLAFSRLNSQLRKLKETPEHFESCLAILNEQLEKGIIEPANRTGLPEHFLPHHLVFGKKPRMVFDASSGVKGGKSLNDLLLPGPNLMPELAGTLLQFRSTNFPVCADIEKAFLMIALSTKDREFSKFLWVKDLHAPPRGNNLIIYRFRRIAFGVISSPFLLAATLQHLLDGSPSPLAVEIKQKKLLYVDNLLLPASTPEEARQKAVEAQAIFASAKMNLREFICHKPGILDSLPPEKLLNDKQPSVLGTSWNLEKDEIILKFPDAPKAGKITRRVILSHLASFFDPLGLCAPCVLAPKLLFQDLWKTSLGWDQPIPETEGYRWTQWLSNWNDKSIHIPRLTPTENVENIQLHIFTDASVNAFATAIYLRSETASKGTSCLIYAKSRLRPKKMGVKEDGLTIPKLELLGLLIGVKAMKFVKQSFYREFNSAFVWCDSQIVLSWLTSTEPKPVFVSNRMNEIRQNRDVAFRYVRSQDNPADLATRPHNPSELEHSGLWWNGPDWLSESECQWPNEYPVTWPPVEAEEPNLATVAVVSPKSHHWTERFSSWRKLLLVMAFILRFLSKKELEEPFPPETYLNEKQIRCLHTRFTRSLGSNFAHPAILPKRSWVCRLLILHSHESTMHGGVDSTLTHFLSEFWCQHARRTIKTILKEFLGQGGGYERLNALIKNCFRRVLGRKLLRWEELYTFLSEVEATINSRPITFVSDEPDGPLAIRPIDLLLPQAQITLDAPNEEDPIFKPSSADKLAQRWWATHRAIDDFWKRWSREYLILLRERRQFHHKGPKSASDLSPKIGQTVLVEMEDHPKNTWPMAKILTLDGTPGHTRSVQLQMPNGRTWNRPVNRLIPLEAAPEPEGPIELPEEEPREMPVVQNNPKKRKWALQPPTQSLALTISLALISLICIPGIQGISSHQLTCELDGVVVTAPAKTTSLEICCEGNCGSRIYKTPFLFPMPVENLVTCYSCTGTYWSNPNSSTLFEAQCPAIDGCLLLQCYLCWERVFNLQCSPWTSAAVIGIAGLVLINVLAAICCCIGTCQKTMRNCRWALSWVCRARNRLKKRGYSMVPRENEKKEPLLSAHAAYGQSSEPIREVLDVYPGRTSRWDPAQISLTPSPLAQPPAPILAGKFLGGWNVGALLPPQPIDLNCPSEWDAISMNCKLAPEACTACRADHADGIVRCHCRNFDAEQLLEDPSYRLPLSLMYPYS
uniref:CCHC-type domain-containing protein n=1 Tax=Globodera rostochiensis TaxID=31243 RepID=A0A914IGQ9_GLORO